VSPILSQILTALGGLLAGFACAGALLWCQHQQLQAARQLAAQAEQRAERAHDLAHQDDTTGLPNRRAFNTCLAQALHAGAPTGVVLLDLDHFKTVNDTYGHELGNDLLTAVGVRLAALPPPVLLAARLSGDEFALIVNGGTEQAAACARAAWQAISAHPVGVDQELSFAVRVSVGYATAATGTTARDLLHRADMAMYEAKQRGTGIASTSGARRPPAAIRCRDLRADHG
jgi:diguanylate cyclase (GGDEF)-like protein